MKQYIKAGGATGYQELSEVIIPKLVAEMKTIDERIAVLNGQVTGTTGELMDSIHYQLDGDFAVEIGSAKDQAAMMQFGGTKEEFPHLWGDIPGREYLGFSAEDKAATLAVIQRHLNS